MSQPSIEALAIAYLASQGKTQIQIAGILKMSQAAVSRLYHEVKDTYIERSFRRELVDDLTWRRLLRRASPLQLATRLQAVAQERGHSAPHVYVIPLREPSDVPLAEVFAMQSAPIVRDLLMRVRTTVGIAWGNTIWHITQALRTLPPQKPWRQIPIDFVPLCGDPLIDSVECYADRTASRIASDLSKIVNGDSTRPAWLGLVPAFIPRHDFNERETKVIDRFIDLVPQYGPIFGPRISRGRSKPPIAEDLHMILTAVGPAEYPVTFGRSALLGLDDHEAKTLRQHIYGDIAGVLLPRIRETSKQQRRRTKPHPLVQELSRHWTGLKMEHLENCASRAFQDKSGLGERPGVTVIAFGTDRCNVVLEAVRKGLVNHLVISSYLEDALEERLSGTKTRWDHTLIK